jgi:FkbM family methyltransferase
MTITSYSQNFEDVVLWRALKHVKIGFYIDVGAWSPVIDSVTRLFYENGWHGINIEPNPEYHRELVDDRQKDINLCLAVSDREGVADMYFTSNPGLSTLYPEIADRHRADGLGLDKQQVSVTTLDAIWREHVPHGEDVHFLKVDAEGAEQAVLRGNDWQKNRPWLVIVEATLPMSQQASHAEWEGVLTGAGYEQVYFDGLNRYYLEPGHGELRDAFSAPPNVFDDFMRYSELLLKEKASKAEYELWRANESAREIAEQLSKSQEIARQLETENEELSAKLSRLQAERDQAVDKAGQLESERGRAIEKIGQLESERGRAIEKIGQMESDLQRMELRASQASADYDRAAVKLRQLESDLRQMEARASQTDAWAADVQQKLHDSQARLHDVLHSKSWRISAPFRWLAHQVRILKSLARKVLQKNRIMQQRNSYRLPERHVNPAAATGSGPADDDLGDYAKVIHDKLVARLGRGGQENR